MIKNLLHILVGSIVLAAGVLLIVGGGWMLNWVCQHYGEVYGFGAVVTIGFAPVLIVMAHQIGQDLLDD